jgi:hypothetical protein
MAIKVEVEQKEKEEMEYPFIGISKIDNTVVFFVGNQKGFVLYPGSDYFVGYHSTSFDMDAFKKFEDKITLSND